MILFKGTLISVADLIGVSCICILYDYVFSRVTNDYFLLKKNVRGEEV